MNDWNSLPEAFLRRLTDVVTAENMARIQSAFMTKRPTTFRANTLKISAASLQVKLEELGFMTEKPTWYPEAFILRNRTQKELTDTTLYTEGFFYVQYIKLVS